MARLPRCGLVALATLPLLLGAPAAQAYEADVHYGLTQWLARKAGFTESQAQSIALGNQRVDSGLVDTLAPLLEYACAGRFPEVAKEVQARHYPMSSPSAGPEQRAVVAGSPAAREPLVRMLAGAVGKEGLMLGKLGEAMHTLQDSWSHAGTPGVPAGDDLLSCDPALAVGHPVSRGGADSHRADLTHAYPADAVAMARASYEVLSAYPRIQGQPRSAVTWEALAPAVEQFTKARSKTEKRAWFAAQGIADTNFLAGTSLPDGPGPGDLVFGGRKLPSLSSAVSTQHDAPADVKRFFDTLLERWLGEEPVPRVLEAFALKADAPRDRGPAAANLRQLTARMTLWKLRDHGAVSDLAHSRVPLSEAQLRAVDRLGRDPAAFIRPAAPGDAVFALLAQGANASPLLPYVVRNLPPSPQGSARAIAILRLQHAPYDTLGWIAQRGAQGWGLVSVVAAVDH